MSSNSDAPSTAQPRKKVVSSATIAFSLAMSLFAFAAAIGAFNPRIGHFMRTTHWEVSHLTLFLGTLALASGIAAMAARRLAHKRASLSWAAACLVWLLVVAAALLFVFRYPARFYVQYNTHTVEDHVLGALEEQALIFDYSPRESLWGTRTTYALTRVGPPTTCNAPGLAGPGQCKLMECVVGKTWWLAGARTQHSWDVQHYSEQEDIGNVQCHEVDPATIQSGIYDEQGRRQLQG